MTHAGNAHRVRKNAFKEAKEIILSNANGFRAGKVPDITAKTMVIMASEEDSAIPFYVAQLLESTEPDKGLDHKVKVQWWTAEQTPKDVRGVYCYEGPVCAFETERVVCCCANKQRHPN